MILLKAELKGDKYYISFCGTKEKFSYYINNIMTIQSKKWDFDNNCWTIPKTDIAVLENVFGNSLQILDEVQQDVDIEKHITGYENYGDMLKLKPYNYQKEAIKFILDQKDTLIVLPCGSGKTVIGIGAYAEAVNKNVITGPGLIVVKATLKVQWEKEVGKFSNYKANIIKTPSDLNKNINRKIKNRKVKLDKIDNKKSKEYKAISKEISELKKNSKEAFETQFNGYDLYITNYESLRNEKIRKKLHDMNFEFIFLDECHYIKDRKSKRSKAVCEFDAKIKVGATATPIGRDPEDIYGIFKFVEPALFDNYSKFATMYVNYVSYGAVPIINKMHPFKNLEHLRKKIAPYVLVKKKEEISKQLPKLIRYERSCSMTEEQEKLNDTMNGELETLKAQEDLFKHKQQTPEITSKLNMISNKILAVQSFAQELADYPQLLNMSDSKASQAYGVKGSESPKLDLAFDLVQEIIDSGEKVCIYSKFERMQKVFAEKFKGLTYREYNGDNFIIKPVKIAHLSGSIKNEDRYKEIYDKFRDSDDYRILLMSDAGAEGLNLSKCQYIIQYDLPNSFMTATQIEGRIVRADSTHSTVYVYRLVLEDSWDEIAQKIVGKGEKYDTEILG